MSTTSAPHDQPRPYAEAALQYRDVGWPAPIPVTGKFPPAKGWTGADGDWPSHADVQAWIEDRGADNIALRLPRGIIGIDVDHYDGKEGGATLQAREQEWGPLPDTWRSTSRSDEVSGIRLYQIPEGGQWPGQLPGGGVDLILWSHRYVMCWPSLHPEGRVYRWTRDGVTALSIPRPDELPRLPVDWVLALCKGPERHEDKIDVGSGPGWLAALPGASDAPCRVMSSAGFAAVAAMSSGAGRHDAMAMHQLDLVRLAEGGHPGGLRVLETLGEAFVALVVSDRQGGEIEAWAEFMRALKGACDRVAAAPSWPPMTQDPCTIGTGKPILLTDSDVDPSKFSDPQIVPGGVSTWGDRLDLAAALEGRLPSVPPTELARSDGALLLYPGKVNALLGPSESGKTWLALLAAAQAISVGRNVVMLDFEDDITGLVGRLRSLGVADDVIRQHMTYLAPAEPLTPASLADLNVVLADVQPALVILDGVNMAMTTMGLDLISNRDASMFHLMLLLPMSQTGAAIVVVDHTPKNDFEGSSMGGIGAQAKRAAVTGASIKVEVIKNFDRRHSGLLKLTVDKDRGGHVRMASNNSRVVGMVHLEPGADGALSVRIEADQSAVDADGEFRPTTLMDRVAEYLTDNPGATQNMILKGVTGNTHYVKDALTALIKDGYVGTTPGPRNSALHSMLRLWSSPLWPTVVNRGSQSGQSTTVADRPPRAVGPGHSGESDYGRKTTDGQMEFDARGGDDE